MENLKQIGQAFGIGLIAAFIGGLLSGFDWLAMVAFGVAVAAAKIAGDRRRVNL